jgi:hypothetical protein
MNEETNSHFSVHHSSFTVAYSLRPSWTAFLSILMLLWPQLHADISAGG